MDELNNYYEMNSSKRILSNAQALDSDINEIVF